MNRRSKILLIRRRYVAAVALCLAVAAIFYVINHPMLVGRGALERVRPIYSVEREHKVMSLSFNATATEDPYTVQVMETLAAFGVRATFFVTCTWAYQHRDLAANLSAHGHEVMALGEHHHFLRMQTDKLFENLNTCNHAIEKATGIRPTMFRVSRGEYDDMLISAVRAMGMQTVQWSIDGNAWQRLHHEAVLTRAAKAAHPGGIVLLYSDREGASELVFDLINTFWREGYMLVPVSELMLQTEYIISPAGKQVAVRD